MKNNVKHIFWIFILIAGCAKNLIITQNSIVLKNESIWQYLKIFSIYQDRIPSEIDALNFSSPQALVYSIKDTLYSRVEGFSNYYGYYSDLWNRKKYRGSSVYGYILSDSLAYLKISSFSNNTVQELIEIPDSIYQKDKLIIDLRDNGGGYIDVCKDIVNMFLPEDIPYIRVVNRKYPNNPGDTATVDSLWYSSYSYTNKWKNKHICVLANPLTASASEILICALKDCMNVPVVGDTTFGKAIGQYVFYLSWGGYLQLTGFRFYRIENKEDYMEKGIAPDYLKKVEKKNEGGIISFPDSANIQLKTAIAILGEDSTNITIPSEVASFSFGVNKHYYLPEGKVEAKELKWLK